MSNKILIVSDIATHPIDGGNRACIWSNVNILKSIGFEPHLLLYNNGSIRSDEIRDTKKAWGKNLIIYKDSSLSRIYNKIKRKFCPSILGKVDHYCPDSLIKFVNKRQKEENFKGLLVNYIWMSKIAKCNIPNKAIYTHDVFTNRADAIQSSYKWMSFSPNEEAKAIKRFEWVLAIQNNEAILFSYLARKSKVIPIYSPMKYVETSIVGNKNILFFSGGGELNISGLKWFLKDIFPIVREKAPEIKLIIGGKICDNLKDEILPENVELKGIYDDSSEFYKLGDIVINPVYQGSGLKIKTIEAIAHGKVLICHPHSSEGMFIAYSLPIISTDNPKIFAKLILESFHRKKIEETKLECKNYINSLNDYIKMTYQKIYQ